MKKAIIKMLSILCVGLMIVSSAGESIYAASYSNLKQQVSVQAKSSKKVTTKKATNKKQTKKHNKNHKKTNKSNKVLTKAQALKLVKKLEPEVKGFTYMGNENTYKCIKQKGIKGYVFLPNCDGDMAYLVDKQTSHIYYFHPSGYFELLK